MRHQHIMKPQEAMLLSGLFSCRLERIVGDTIEAFLVASSGPPLCLHYLSGIGASPYDEKEELIRVEVREAKGSSVSEALQSRYAEVVDVGDVVRDVSIVNCYVVFGNPVMMPPSRMGSIKLKAGPSYDVVQLDPEGRRARSIERQLVHQGLLNEVDVGVRLILEDRSEIVITTDGFTSFVNIFHTPPTLGDLVGKVRYLPLSARGCKEPA